MKIVINGQQIPLNPIEVKSAKRNAERILQHVRSLSEKHHLTSYFYTFLIVMHVMTQELIDTFDAKDFKEMMTRLNQAKEKRE